MGALHGVELSLGISGESSSSASSTKTVGFFRGFTGVVKLSVVGVTGMRKREGFTGDTNEDNSEASMVVAAEESAMEEEALVANEELSAASKEEPPLKAVEGRLLQAVDELP